MDEARAFEVPRRYFQNINLELRDVAAQLTATRRHPTSARRYPSGPAIPDLHPDILESWQRTVINW
jgi:hypothetical protein